MLVSWMKKATIISLYNNGFNKERIRNKKYKTRLVHYLLSARKPAKQSL